MKSTIDPLGVCLAISLVGLATSGCQFNGTTYTTLADASAACYRWRQAGKPIQMRVKANENGKEKEFSIKTFNRDCKYDSHKDAYVGSEMKNYSAGGTIINTPDKAYEVRLFRLSR